MTRITLPIALLLLTLAGCSDADNGAMSGGEAGVGGDGGAVGDGDPDRDGGRDGGLDAGGDSGGDANVDPELGAPGAACKVGSECEGGHCVDGVCCDAACDGVCEACNARGVCEGTADDDACGDLDCDGLDETCRDYHDVTADRCKAAGKCKQANTPLACTDYTDTAALTPCSDPYCNVDNELAVDACDGAGACVADLTPDDCGAYLCDPAGCPTDCDGGNDCLEGVCDRRTNVCPTGVLVADCAAASDALETVAATCPGGGTCYILVSDVCEKVSFTNQDLYIASDGTGAVHDPGGDFAVDLFEDGIGADARLAIDGLDITGEGGGGTGISCYAAGIETAEIWTFDTYVFNHGQGFSIAACDLKSSGDKVEGNGENMILADCNATLSDCMILDAILDEGIGVTGSSTVEITDCIISGGVGPGLQVNDSIATVLRTTFDANAGDGVRSVGNANVTVTDSTIKNGGKSGVASHTGGTLTLLRVTSEGHMDHGALASGGTLDIDRSTFRDNTGDGVHGGTVGTTAVAIRASTITGNLHGVFMNTASIDVQNSFIVDNDGVGFYVLSESAVTKVFRHNTVVGNGTGAWCSGSMADTSIERSLFENTGTEVSACTVDATSDVPGVSDACADAAATPIFEDAGSGDYHLGALSTCVDAIVCDVAITDDFDGDTRPTGALCDVGADEAL